MIYVCEYDDLADDAVLQERLDALLMSFPELESCGLGRAGSAGASRAYTGISEAAGVQVREKAMGTVGGKSAMQVGKETPGTAGDGARRRKLRERLLARRLLDFALRQEYGISLQELGWECGPDGKPFGRAHPEIAFNISHCGTACAAVVGSASAASQVGIDIERKFAYRENLAKKVCSAAEWRVLQTLDEEQRAAQLRFLWSMKESFVKWDGRGLGYGMNKIDLSEYLPLTVPAGEVHRFGRFLLCHTASFTLAVYGEQPEEVRYKTETELVRQQM